MKKLPLILAAVVTAVLLTGVGGAAAWYTMKPKVEPTPEMLAEQAAEEARKHPPRYVSLDKVVVMLRRENGDSASHYLAIDLVFKTSEKQEKVTRDHLPMLRSVAVRSLSALTPSVAGGMTIDQFADEVNRAYQASYDTEKRDKPFTEVMIGKLIIE
jgi:flagellar protein FliL